MKRMLIFVLIGTLLSSCFNSDSITGNVNDSETYEEIIYHVRPVGDFDKQLAKLLSLEIEKYYGFETIIDQPIMISDSLFVPGRARYDASRVIETHSKKNYTILLTKTDLAYDLDRDGYSEWGIFGIGDFPGKTCIVSTYRLGQKRVSKDKFQKRFIATCLHEIGHNLGLDHCLTKGCLMEAAGGKMSVVDNSSAVLCDNCKSQLMHSKFGRSIAQGNRQP